jgi:predicted nucleotidyltransferase
VRDNGSGKAMTATDILSRLNVSADAIGIFCRKWGVRELAVFGSAARGEMRSDSDVDVMVEFEAKRERRPWDSVDMKLELEGLFARPVDMIPAGPIENPFRRVSIQRDLTVIYAA